MVRDNFHLQMKFQIELPQHPKKQGIEGAQDLHLYIFKEQLFKL